MSRSPTAGRLSDTDGAILDAARALFEAGGYHAVGLEAVAAKAGVSRQSIYLHFDSKAALLLALHERINDIDVVPVMSKVWDAPDACAGLAAFAAATTATASKIVAIYTALDAAARSDPEVAASMRLGSERRYGDCLRLAAWLHEDGSLGVGVTQRHAADVIWAIANIPSYVLLVRDRRWSQNRWTTWVTETLRATLLEPRTARAKSVAT